MLLEFFEDFLWGYLSMPAIVFLGIALTIQSRAFQIREFPFVLVRFVKYFSFRSGDRGIHPLKAFFACVGGCVGVGNIVGICTAIQAGGPGALFWIWLTAIAGMIVKYSEVYLGIRYRVKNGKGGYDGGPMYFLQKATKITWVPVMACCLLSIYGVELYQFRVITESMAGNFHLPKELVAGVLLLMVLFAGSGGVARVGAISSAVIPFFVILFMGMGGWVLWANASALPNVFHAVFSEAFTGRSAAGGILGSAIIMTISQGVRRGCYSTDIGVGYASVIHSESSVDSPEKQASLVLIDIFLDTFAICTMSVMLILSTGVWKEPLEAGMLIQTVFERHFPYMNYFMPLFLFLLGYSTITAYFCVGLKCAEFVSNRWGKLIFYFYATLSLTACVFIDTSKAQAVMAVSGGLLLLINCLGIWRLRKELSFKVPADQKSASVLPAIG